MKVPERLTAGNVLALARDIIGRGGLSESGMARDARGDPCPVDSDEAVRFSVRGSIVRAGVVIATNILDRERDFEPDELLAAVGGATRAVVRARLPGEVSVFVVDDIARGDQVGAVALLTAALGRVEA